MTKEEWKNNKDFDKLSREMRGGFGATPDDTGIDSAHSLNLSDSADASFLKQQWDTKKPLKKNKPLPPEAQ